MDDLKRGVWRELSDRRPVVDTFRRNLQRGYLERMAYLMTQEFNSPFAFFFGTTVDVSQSDIRPFVRGQLEELQREDRTGRAAHPRRGHTPASGGRGGTDPGSAGPLTLTGDRPLPPVHPGSECLRRTTPPRDHPAPSGHPSSGEEGRRRRCWFQRIGKAGCRFHPIADPQACAFGRERSTRMAKKRRPDVTKTVRTS